MIYVFDSNSLIDLFKHYYPSRFPSLWEKFDALVLSENITSVREVATEITQRDDRLSDWTKTNKTIFPISSADELKIVADIFVKITFRPIFTKRNAFRVKPLQIRL